MIIEMAMTMPSPIASYISSYILPVEPVWLVKGQLRNYLPIYVSALIILILCLVYVALVFDEVKEVHNPDDNLMKRLSVRSMF